MDINCDSHKLNKFFMFESLKSLHKDIGYLVSHRDIVEFNITIVDAFMDEMLMYLDVFRACVESQKVGLTASAKAPWLSPRIVVGIFEGNPMSWRYC